MRGLLVEPSSLPGDRRARAGTPGHEARPPGNDLSTPSPPAALVAGSLAACVVGLVGAPSGLVWIVAGVFTARSVVGTRPGLAWGIACLGAGLRWGTLGLADVGVSARLFGPTVLAGAPLVRAGMIAAVVAALVDESRREAATDEGWAGRGASAAAIVALVALFFAPGSADLIPSAATWAIGAGIGAGVVTAARPATRLLPAWLPPGLAAVGVVAAQVAL